VLADAPSSLPAAHRAFLERALATLASDARIVGVAIGGSYLADAMDEFSDLDLVIAVEREHHAALLAAGATLAAQLGELLVAFTGEHVGEPRLLICLFDRPLLHVDLKFVALDDVAVRVEDPAVVWEREERLSAALRTAPARYPAPDAQWIEDRFWVWVHYGAVKIARGELFEAIELLSALRVTVLGPLALAGAGARPAGVRRIETQAPAAASALTRTLADATAPSCVAALAAAVEIYRSLRAASAALVVQDAAEAAAVRYLAGVERAVRARAAEATAR
jgi:hypothetical protein